MATFTTVTKSPVSWEAPPPEENSSEAYELLIGDTYKLDIGSGYNLTIQPASVPIVWTNTTKTPGGHKWPAEAVEQSDVFLNIGDGYNLLVGDTYKLIIDPARSEVIWTTVSRDPAKY